MIIVYMYINISSYNVIELPQCSRTILKEYYIAGMEYGIEAAKEKWDNCYSCYPINEYMCA